jgi:hypothetical protein
MNEQEAKGAFKEGAALYEQGHYQAALDILTQLDRQFPNNVRVQFPIARCLAKLGRTDEAMRLCEQLIASHNHQPAMELRARLQPAQPGAAETVPGAPPVEATSLEALSANLDQATEEGVFANVPPPPPQTPARRGPNRLLVGGAIVVVLVVVIGAAAALLQGDDSQDAPSASSQPNVSMTVQTQPDTAETASTTAPPEETSSLPPIDRSGPPELVKIQSGDSADGVTVNMSVDFGVWTNVGSYEAFLAKYRACEPAAIRMETMGTFVMEYRVLGDESGECQIEVRAVQFPMYDNWSGKSMVCPCDTSYDFIEQTEYLGMQGILDGSLVCEGPLYDAMAETFAGMAPPGP